MTMRFATKEEIAQWDELLLANPDGSTIFQSAEFAAQKVAGGWKSRFITDGALAVTILEQTVIGLGKIWYIPKGPGVATIEHITAFVDSVRVLAHQNNVFLVKIEPEFEKDDETSAQLAKLDLIPVSPIQPNFSTVLVDISDDLDTVLASLNQKGRHAIRRAKRDGVTIERVETNEKNCRVFYDLLAETAAGSFIIRPYEYYRDFWKRFSAAGMGQLFFARYEGEVVAIAYGLVFGTKSTYKDGASVRKRTAYGASHLLQWEIITWAKEHGSTLHDLCGAPPSDRINDETHPHYGIGRFKTSFNKQVTDYVGAYDIITNPRKYTLWTKIGERIVISFWWRTHHESWY